jgi:sugar-specific transcriptional regulator TrmB
LGYNGDAESLGEADPDGTTEAPTIRTQSQWGKRMGETVNTHSIDKLVRLGLSEYEARAYLALLRKNPVTGHGLARLSGVPRSMIARITDGLVARGAVVTLPEGGRTKYAPVPAKEFLERLHREHGELMAALKEELGSLAAAPDLDRVWNITGRANIVARARSIIGQARSRIHLATWTATLPALRPALEEAIGRDVQVVVYTTGQLDLPGGRVVVTPVAEGASGEKKALGLILVRDGQEVLISEWLEAGQAQASWTHNPTLVSIAEHHLVRGGRRRFLIPGSGTH